MSGMPVRVIGLDLSLTATGIALSDGSTTTVKTRTKDGDGRLTVIKNHVRIAVGGPDFMGSPGARPADLVVIEDLPTHASAAGITGMVQGVVRELLHDHGVPYRLVPPATLKFYATGKGNADKAAMRIAAFKRAGVEFPDDNCCDAWWLRAMGREALGHPVVDLPAAQRAKLNQLDLARPAA